MKLKLFVFLIYFPIILFNAFGIESTESPLEFSSFRRPDCIVIPQDINFDEFEVFCDIEYSYSGNWIGRCSGTKVSYTFKEYTIFGSIVYLDDNSNELCTVDFPESLKEIKQRDWEKEETWGEPFAFKEDYYLYVKIPLFLPGLFELNKIKALIFSQNLRKIQIVINKVEVKWKYLCISSDKSQKEINKEGKFEFLVDKSFMIPVIFEPVEFKKKQNMISNTSKTNISDSAKMR